MLYLLPNGRRRGWRTPPVLSCSTASQDALGAIIERRRQDRNAWATKRRIRLAVRAGFDAHRGERAHWLRVSQRGIDARQMARRWVEFHRDQVKPTYPDFGDWFRVTGTTKSGIAHAHVVWFGGYLPKSWLIDRWGRFSGGDDAVWVEAVKGETGGGVARYLSRQFVEYLAGQEIRARWSCSAGWRASGGSEGPAGPPTWGHGGSPEEGAGCRGAETGKAALEFVQGGWYSPGRPVGGGPLPRVYADASKRLHSMLTVSDLVVELDGTRRHGSEPGP